MIVTAITVAQHLNLSLRTSGEYKLINVHTIHFGKIQSYPTKLTKQNLAQVSYQSLSLSHQTAVQVDRTDSGSAQHPSYQGAAYITIASHQKVQ